MQHLDTSSISPEIVARMVLHLTEPLLAKKSFQRFVQRTMPDYQLAEHHRLIMGALQMVEEGKIRFLIICLPPRHGKSELVSIRFPAFCLGRHPDWDLIHISYAADLSNDFSRRVRAILRDDLNYRSLFRKVELDPERSRVDDWRLTGGGGFRSVGTGGGVSGRGADLLIIDDPHKEGEISRSTLKQTFEWYASGARTRLMPGARLVLCMTRWDLLDMVGQVIRAANSSPDADQWYVLNLPALAEEDDPLGREPGEALWPAWYPREALLSIKALSEVYFQALFQQDPRAVNIQMFADEDWRKVDHAVVKCERPAWCFDLALGEDEAGDYTAWARVMYDSESHDMGFSHLFRQRLTWPDAKEKIEELIKLYPDDDFVFPKQSFELMAVQTLRHDNPGARIQQVSFPAGSDKRSRAQVLAERVKKHHVLISDRELTPYWISEHSDFPADHDDCVDVGSVATHHFGLQHEFAAAIVDAEAKARRKLQRLEEQRAALERLGYAVAGAR